MEHVEQHLVTHLFSISADLNKQGLFWASALFQFLCSYSYLNI